jgi:hypothetical protein
MSYSNSNSKKPYCKVCFDAGKTEKEYTSHWVKDLTGKTTCPTLLSNKCRYCNKSGHTVKFCTLLKKDELREKEQKEKQPVKNNKKEEQKPNLAVLFDEDSDIDSDIDCDFDNKKVNKAVDTFTNNVNKLVVPQPHFEQSWSSIVSKPKPIPTKTIVKSVVSVVKPEKTLAPWAVNKGKKNSWADFTDSEDEDDYEDETSDVTSEPSYSWSDEEKAFNYNDVYNKYCENYC